MFIDYITLLLVNMTAGLVLLACFFLVGLNSPNHRPWAPAFAAVGAVAFLVGLHMTLTWPIPDLSAGGPNLPNLRFANVAFGEMSVLLGVLFLGAALVAAKGWDLLPLSVYAVFAGLAAIVVGAAIGKHGLTLSPGLTAAGFVVSGLAGVFSPVALLVRRRLARVAMTVLLVLAAGVWAVVGYGAYWRHVEDFSRPAKIATTAQANGSRAGATQTREAQPSGSGAGGSRTAETRPAGDVKDKILREMGR